LSKIKDLGLDAISEDEFLDLIAYREAGGGELDETQKKKLEKEREEMENQAAAMAKREKEEEALRQRKAKVLSKEGVATRSVRQTNCAFPHVPPAANIPFEMRTTGRLTLPVRNCGLLNTLL
jgi:hypothetical protein